MSTLPDPVVTFFKPLIILFLLLAVWSIAEYILTSLSLFRIGKQLKIRAYGLAWVPVLSVWSIGAIADKQDERIAQSHKFRWVLLWLALVYLVLLAGFLFVYYIQFKEILHHGINIGNEADITAFYTYFWSIFAAEFPFMMVSYTLLAVTILCLYKLIELCKPEKVLKNILIGLLVPFAAPFVLLSCSKALRSEEPALLRSKDFDPNDL